MKRVSVVIVALALCGQSSGCATLFASKSKSLMLTSEPTNAEVLINGQSYGRTPISVKLSNKSDYAVTFRLQGHGDRSYNIGRSVGAGWVILDVLAGLVPVIIDAATGSWYSLSEPAVHGVLRSEIAPTDSISIPESTAAPFTITLEGGSVLGVRSARPWAQGLIKVETLDGESQYLNAARVKSISDQSGRDWTEDVLDRGKRLPQE